MAVERRYIYPNDINTLEICNDLFGFNLTNTQSYGNTDDINENCGCHFLHKWVEQVLHGVKNDLHFRRFRSC